MTPQQLGQHRDVPRFDVRELPRLMKNRDVLREHPCVVDGFVTSWPGFENWRDMAFLEREFGSLPCRASAPLEESFCRVGTTFRTYLEYVRHPERAERLFAGRWEVGDFETYVARGIPLYCGDLRFAKDPGALVQRGLDPLLPDGVECWNSYVPLYHAVRNHFWLFVSPAGALTPLHADDGSVCVYLAQFAGTKRATLFSPADDQHVYSAEHGWLDPMNPDRRRFSTCDAAVAWTTTLGPGQLLLWGGDWSHHVLTLERSITLSFDFVNQTNLAPFVHDREWLTRLGRHVRAHPELMPAGLPFWPEDRLIGKLAVVDFVRRKLVGDVSGLHRSVLEQLLDLVERES